MWGGAGTRRNGLLRAKKKAGVGSRPNTGQKESPAIAPGLKMRMDCLPRFHDGIGDNSGFDLFRNMTVNLMRAE